MDRLKPTYLDGPADLAVEVVSPESAGRDRGDKYYEYERAGITEYWLIDPQTERAEFYQLDAAERYHLILPDGDGLYHSAILPGLWLRVAWLWQDPPPPAEDALLAIEGEALIQRLRERLGGQGEAPSR
jgi:Uma2 family endonuclease